MTGWLKWILQLKLFANDPIKNIFRKYHKESFDICIKICHKSTLPILKNRYMHLGCPIFYFCIWMQRYILRALNAIGFHKRFSNKQDCYEYLAQLKWEDDYQFKKCGYNK